MIKVYQPLLLDFIRIAIQMPPDERAQIEAFTGQVFDVDGAAIGNFCAPGPKWVIKDGDEPLVVGGFAPERPGVWRDYLLTTPDAFKAHAFALTRICRRHMDLMFKSGQAHRLECVVPAARLSARPELEKWYKVLGYSRESTMAGYCANGADAVMFSRVQHGHR